MVFPELAHLPQQVQGSTPRELKVVDEQITTVIKKLNEELRALNDSNFWYAAHIKKNSFGAGGPAQQLAVHYTRAHKVTVEMIEDLKTDLRAFRRAVREARELVRTTDEDAAADLALLLRRAEGVDMGADGYDQGKNQHAGATPTETNPTDADDPTTEEDE